ncbi:unnamed protein product [Anisakis simplex]|uniref:SF3A3 domain-containing protein n=1 Tax=Anisakis simplex TaxID=6269 RepID=A0A0M3JEJ8_ANISI|nr:unnamed protein product [Anisakis simplex]
MKYLLSSESKQLDEVRCYSKQYLTFISFLDFRIEEYEQALKEWEEMRPPGSASSADPFGHYKQKFEERQQAKSESGDTQENDVKKDEGQEDEKGEAGEVTIQ